MPPSTELEVAIRLTGIGRLRTLRQQLRGIVRDARRANRALQGLQGMGAGRGGRAATEGAGRGRVRRRPPAVTRPAQTALMPAGQTMFGGMSRQMQQGLRQGRAQVRKLGRQFQTMGKTGQKGFSNVTQGARRFSGQMQRAQRFAKLTQDVLEAYILYRGFVFLSEQARELVSTMVDLEEQAALVQTQLNEIGGVDFQSEIERQVLGVAQNTGAELESLSEVQFDIVSANIEMAESYDFLNATAKAMVAGGLEDARTAFKAAITQQNAFEDQTNSVTETLDKQFAALRRGIFTYEQFVQISGTVSTAFANIGQDAEQANAAVAAVSQVFTGQQLRRGATGLRNMAIAIGENSEQLRDLGVQVFDQQGDFRDFNEIVTDLSEELEGLSEEEKFRALQEVFPRKRALRGALALTANIEELNQFLVEQRFAAGRLEESFDTMNDTFANTAERLSNELVPAGRSFVGLLDGMAEAALAVEDAVPGALATGLTGTFALGAAAGGRAFLPSMFGAPTGGRANVARGGGLGQRMALQSQMTAGLTARASFLPRGQAARGLASQFRPGAIGRRLGAGGLALVGGGALLSGIQAQQEVEAEEGIQAGSIAKGAVGPAIAGGVAGGLPGAVVGGLAGATAATIGEAMEEEGEQSAKTFTEAFEESLEQNASNIQEAFTSALVQGDVQGAQPLTQFASFLAEGQQDESTTFGDIERRREAQQDNLVRETLTELGQEFGLVEGARSRGMFPELNRAVGDFLGFRSGFAEQQARGFQVPSLPAAASQARTASERTRQQFRGLDPRAQSFLREQGLAPESAAESAAKAKIRELVEEEGELSDTTKGLIDQFENLAKFAAESDASTKQINDAFQELTDTVGPASDELEDVRDEISLLEEMRDERPENFGEMERQRLADLRVQEAELTDELNSSMVTFVKTISSASEAMDEASKSSREFEAASSRLKGELSEVVGQISDTGIEGPFANILTDIERIRKKQDIAETIGGLRLERENQTIRPFEDVEAQFNRQMTQQIERRLNQFIHTGGEVDAERFREVVNRIVESGDNASRNLRRFGNVSGTSTDQLQTLFEDIQFGLEENLIRKPISLGNTFENMSKRFELLNRSIQAANIAKQFQTLAQAAGDTAQAELFQGAREFIAERVLSQVESIVGETPSAISSEELGRELMRAINFQSKVEDFRDKQDQTSEDEGLPGQTQLTQTFEDASDALENNLIASSRFTGDQMRQIGEDLTQFNRTIRKAQLIEEFERIAQTVRPGVDLSSQIQTTLSQLQLGGETLGTLLQNPEELANFLTDVEFGDVTVDKSETNQFTIRISTTEGTMSAAELADNLEKELNKRNRSLQA